MTVIDRKIVHALAIGGPFDSINDLAAALDVKPNAAHKSLTALEKAGIVTLRKSGRDTIATLKVFALADGLKLAIAALMQALS